VKEGFRPVRDCQRCYISQVDRQQSAELQLEEPEPVFWTLIMAPLTSAFHLDTIVH